MRFEGLSQKTRSDVEAAAERRELHTDPAIAASSIEWAHRRLARRKMAGELALLAIGAAINAIALANLPEGDGLRDFWREQRLCKRITKLRHAPDSRRRLGPSFRQRPMHVSPSAI